MTKLLIVICLLALFAYGCAQEQVIPSQTVPAQNTAASGNGFLTHEDPDYKVRITYPSSWSLGSDDQAIFVIKSPSEGSGDAFSENVNLVMNDLSGQDVNLETYTDLSIKNLESAGYAIEKSDKAMLAGIPAERIVFTDGKGMKFMQVFTIKDGISYVLTFTSETGKFEANLLPAERMIASFQTTGSLRAPQAQPQTEVKAQASPFVGKWRVYSERIFYDIGGAGALGISVSRNLEIKDGSWNFGDSNGKWTVSEITADDWARWGVDSYGPKRKMTLEGWNKGVADGPIEESEGNVDFIWVIYHVEPPLVENAGTVWIKFGKV